MKKATDESSGPASPPVARRRHRPDFPLLVILAVGIALRFIALGRQSFWHDEIDSVMTASGGPGDGLLEIILNIHGPLYLVLLKGWMALVGDGEGAIRILSALLGSVGLVLFYRAGLRLVGRAAALAGLALLAVSPYFLWYSQEARNYALLFDVGLLAVPAFLADIERRTRGTFAATLITTVAACLANLSGFFLLAFHAVYGLTAGRREGYPIRRLAVLLLVAVVVLSPWILRAGGTTGELHLGRPEEGSSVLAVKGESPPGLLSIPFTFYSFSLGFSVGPSIEELKIHGAAALVPHLPYLISAAGLFGLLALWGLIAVRKSARLFWILLLWASIPVALMLFLSALNLKAPNPRYASLAFAPYLLLIAWGVVAIRYRVVRAVVLILLLLVSLRSDYQYFTNPRYWRPNVRGAGELLRREGRADDVFVAYSLIYPVTYYMRGFAPMVRPRVSDFADEASMERWLRLSVGDRERMWIVQCHGWWMDPQDRFLGLCRRIMIPAGEWRLTGVPIYLFERPPDWESPGDEAGEPET